MIKRIPILDTERLFIRELAMEDLDRLNQIFDTGGIMEMAPGIRERWLRWTVLGYEMFEILEQPHYGERGIVLRKSGELIGAVGIVPYMDSFGGIAAFNGRPGDPVTAEVGLFWVVASEYRRQGYASEAARAIVSYLFQEVNLGRIIATTGKDNLASQAVMRKLGMTVEHTPKPHTPGKFVVGVITNPSTMAE